MIKVTRVAGPGLSLEEDCSNPLQFLGGGRSACVPFCNTAYNRTNNGLGHVWLETTVGSVALGDVPLPVCW